MASTHTLATTSSMCVVPLIHTPYPHPSSAHPQRMIPHPPFLPLLVQALPADVDADVKYGSHSHTFIHTFIHTPIHPPHPHPSSTPLIHTLTHRYSFVESTLLRGMNCHNVENKVTSVLCVCV